MYYVKKCTQEKKTNCFNMENFNKLCYENGKTFKRRYKFNIVI